MILTCPSCSASYNVPVEAIGINGRTVRCKKCRHEWFQSGEKKALEDLISLVQATEIDDIDFDDVKAKAKTKSVPKKTDKLASLKTLLSKLKGLLPEKLKLYLFSGDNRGFLSHLASFMVAFAIFTCFLYIFVSQRLAITSVFPSLTSTYEAAGFPLVDYSRLNPEDALAIDRMIVEMDSGRREIIGSLMNLTSQNVKVPAFKLAYQDVDGVVILEQTERLPIQILKKELSYNFNILVPESVPSGFSAVKVSFTD